MFQLAYHGYTLYRTFFPTNSRLRGLLDQLPHDWRVDIYWGKQIDPNWVAHVPWRLPNAALRLGVQGAVAAAGVAAGLAVRALRGKHRAS